MKHETKLRAVKTALFFYFFMRKEVFRVKRYAVLFALIIALIAYAMVSTAAKHAAKDEEQLRIWWYNTALSRK